MSVPFSGSRSRSLGVLSAIIKQLKIINLKPVKKITVQFDPFHEKVKHTRDFLYYISSPKVQATSLSCQLKTNIVCDRSEPTVTLNLDTGDNVVFKCANLTALEILQQYNKHITSAIPPDPLALAAKAELESKKKKKKKKPKKLFNPEGKHRPRD